MAKGSSSRSAPKATNASLTKRVIAAEAKVDQARAKANLVKAQIEVKGKQVTYDWKDGMSIPKVVDAPKVK